MARRSLLDSVSFNPRTVGTVAAAAVLTPACRRPVPIGRGLASFGLRLTAFVSSSYVPSSAGHARRHAVALPPVLGPSTSPPCPLVSSPKWCWSRSSQWRSRPAVSGTAPVEVSTGVSAQPTEIPVLTYVGPVPAWTASPSPRRSFLYFGDSLRFQYRGSSADTRARFYVSWRTSDTALAAYQRDRLAARTAVADQRGVHRAHAGAIADSWRATFSRFRPADCDWWRGTDGIVAPLGLPLEVEVRAADNLPSAASRPVPARCLGSER